ncbi:2-hydroxyacid dehydrogenase [Pseudahrensia aquimaris]|uniref:2-hydroxyacid dehydrogenase n=1 Tax=Pseudahrensia aquimaris TaxID=744461 RepID=A0ABW3FGE8_9HYPH
MSKELLIIGNFNPPIADKLSDLYTVHHTTKDEIAASDGKNFQGVTAVATFGYAPQNLIDKLPSLEMISSFGVGYDGVAAEHAASKGIMVGHTPDVLNDDVANTTIMLLLATMRRLVLHDKYVRSGAWEKNGDAPLTRSIAGKTVGIVGLGRIGEAIAHKLSVFNCEVVYHSRNEKPGVAHRYYGDLVEMASASDVLIVITPGGPATNKLINTDVMNALGPDGTIINLSRGTVIDEQAMISALSEGRLGAAGLDVFEKEPHVPEVLCKMDNVVLQPHVGSATEETRAAMAQRVVDNLRAFEMKGAPINLVPECEKLRS